MDNTLQKEISDIKPVSRQAVLRAELEATRETFHRLLEFVAASSWAQKSPSSAWTSGEVLVHLTWALGYLPEEVERARHGKGMFNLPKQLSDVMSYWYIRWIARRATPQTIARRYDRAMDASLRKLEAISDNDWKNGADFYREGFHNVEDLFHEPAHHLEEHTKDWPKARFLNERLNGKRIGRKEG